MAESEKKCEHFSSENFECERESSAMDHGIIVQSRDENVDKNQPMGRGGVNGRVGKERRTSKRDSEGKPATAFGYRKSLSAAVSSSKELLFAKEEPGYGPVRPRRNSLANSAGYLRKLSVNACNKTATSMKKITVFTNFKKALTSSDEYNPVITPLNGAVSLTRPSSFYTEARKNGTYGPFIMGNTCDKEVAFADNGFGSSLKYDSTDCRTELEKTDPEFVKYFRDNVSKSDKEVIRKYIELKQQLDEKLEQLESEYTKLLGLTSNVDLECKLDTLDSTYGDDLIFHCVNLFESHEAPEKVMALSAHRDFENYLRTLHGNVFSHVFNIINLKTLQNSIKSSNFRETKCSSSGWKKNTQVYESNLDQGGQRETFSVASFLCPLSTNREKQDRRIYQYDAALAALKGLAEERLDPLMRKAALVPNVSSRHIKHISRQISIMCESFDRTDSTTPVPEDCPLTSLDDVIEPRMTSDEIEESSGGQFLPHSETCSTITDLDFELIN